MKKIEENTLDEITGGNTTISGPIINSIVNIIKVLKDAGYSIGSGIRRISEDCLCPLD